VPGPIKKGHRTLSVDEQHLWDKIAQTTDPIKGRHDYLITQDIYDHSIDLLAHATSKTPSLPKSKPSGIPGKRSAQPRSSPPQAAPLSDTRSFDRRTKLGLKKGKLRVEGTLDLHGHTQDQAHDAVGRFVHAAAKANKRYVLIITGKGRMSETPGGVLRRAVPQWLRRPPLSTLISGIDEAAPRDGGEGALYVRIKRPK